MSNTGYSHTDSPTQATEILRSQEAQGKTTNPMNNQQQNTAKLLTIKTGAETSNAGYLGEQSPCL